MTFEYHLLNCCFFDPMPKDSRYKAVKQLLEAGGIKTLPDIFDFIPRKVVYQDMGINYQRFKRLVGNPYLFTIEELATIGRLFDVETRLIIDMTLASKTSTKSPKKKAAKK
jgi:hypothetical protein